MLHHNIKIPKYYNLYLLQTDYDPIDLTADSDDVNATLDTDNTKSSEFNDGSENLFSPIDIFCRKFKG